MRRSASFMILAVVLLVASLAGCAGSSRQVEDVAVSEEQAPDQQVERVVITREQTPEGITREQYAAAGRELRAAVEAGRITEEQARERMAGMRERMARERTTERITREQYAATEREYRAAVEAGRITGEQARERLAGMRERMGQEQATESGVRERYAAVGRELRAAVAAGTITEEQARERMVAMRERMAAAARGAGERESVTLTREQIGQIRAELAAAVEAGRITGEQAKERMAGMRTRMAPGRETVLFNGRDLSGWEYFLTDETATMEDVWSIEDGILVCQGDPRGYLATADEYENYQLVVEWRWPEEPGNSGVLLRITGEPEMLPNCAEAQLRSGSAGDMYGFNGFKIGGDEERLSEISIGWSLPGIEKNENEPGEWNRYEITVRGGTIRVMLNGKLVNEAIGCDIHPGKIGLQSEGGVIHFRTVKLTSLGGE